MKHADNERGPRVRLTFTGSRFLDFALPLLGGLGIAILAALIMKYV